MLANSSILTLRWWKCSSLACHKLYSVGAVKSWDQAQKQSSAEIYIYIKYFWINPQILTLFYTHSSELLPSAGQSLHLRHGSTSLLRQPRGCCTQPPLGTSKHRLRGTAPAARFAAGTSPAADGSTYGSSSSDELVQMEWDVLRIFFMEGLVKTDVVQWYSV